MSPHLADARADAHYASQLLAAIGHTVLGPDEAFHHSSATYDAGALVGAKLPNGSVARLQLATLTLHLGGDALPLAGRSMQQATNWIESRIEKKLQFPDWDLPDGPAADRKPFRPVLTGLDELAQWYDVAAKTLADLAPDVVKATATRVWPHHFDIARLFTLREGADAENSTSIGVGMTPGDASISDPYLYVTPWPYPDDRPTPPLPAGRFQVEGWYGAVLEASAVEHVDAIESFVPAAYDLLHDLLTRRDA